MGTFPQPKRCLEQCRSKLTCEKGFVGLARIPCCSQVSKHFHCTAEQLFRLDLCHQEISHVCTTFCGKACAMRLLASAQRNDKSRHSGETYSRFSPRRQPVLDVSTAPVGACQDCHRRVGPSRSGTGRQGAKLKA